MILPTFNRVDLLARAIGSVMGQTFADWELLVVDDASETDVERVVARCRDPRVRYLRRAVNGGVAAAQNTGIDHARGELVAFLHSDDELLPEKLGHQVGLIARSPATIGAVESGIEVVWPGHTEHWPPGLDGSDAFDVLAYRARVNISGLLVRRALAAQLRFDEQLRGAEDRDFCVRLLQHTTLAFSREPLSRVAKTGDRLSHQNKGPVYEHLLHKYQDIIATDHRVHADWQYRIGRAYARAGQMPQARRALREALRLDPARRRRWLLWLASFGGDRLYGAAFEAQVRAAAAIKHTRRRAAAVR